MSEKHLPRYLTAKEFREQIANWDKDALLRRRRDGMPAIKIGEKNFIYPTQECLDWIKRRANRAS